MRAGGSRTDSEATTTSEEEEVGESEKSGYFFGLLCGKVSPDDGCATPPLPRCSSPVPLLLPLLLSPLLKIPRKLPVDAASSSLAFLPGRFASMKVVGQPNHTHSLALRTISCHFRCLRDAISGQIQVARKSLGEPDNSSSMTGGLSRLRHIDQQLRQQRAMQQFGVMQPNAWRPQRGLPESSVSILRAWLFEHFLHPYPKNSEKLMLARKTGLSRSQVLLVMLENVNGNAACEF